MKKNITLFLGTLLMPMLFYSCDHEHSPFNNGKIVLNGSEIRYDVSCVNPEIGENVSFVFDKSGNSEIGIVLNVNETMIEIANFPFTYNTAFLSEGSHRYSIACGQIIDGESIKINVNTEITNFINVEND